MENKIIKTIKQNACAELIEKKSRFIANIYIVENKEQAEGKIKEIKKKYYDAKHNCFAYSVLEDNQTIVKMSDDGEPSGTAGEPILNIILKNGLQNVLIIVTRYFGGILLGAGGLTRAYSNASKQALANTEIEEKQLGVEVKLELNYSDSEKFKYFCNKNNIKINKIEYKENIFYFIELTDEKLREILNEYSAKNEKKDINIISCVELCRKYIKIVK